MFVSSQFQTLIPRRSASCVCCNESLRFNADYVTHLQTIDENPKRSDFCIPCWTSIEHEKKKEKGIFWKGHIPPKKETVPTSDEQALQLFRSLAMDSTSNPKMLYVLSLYLERKKHLHKRSELNKRKQSLNHYEVAESGEIFVVERCLLTRAETEEVFLQLRQSFENVQPFTACENTSP